MRSLSAERDELPLPNIPRQDEKEVQPTDKSVDVPKGSASVAPFLSRHLPETLSPGSGPMTKRTFCYRHRPDVICRKTPDEPTVHELQASMEKLESTDQQAISHIWSLFSASPGSHRQLILQGLLAQCCLSQLSYISGALKTLIRIDPVANFPVEVAYKIFGYLDSKSLCRAAQVSKAWKKLADDDHVWHRMCQQHIDKKCTQCGWALPLLEKKRKGRPQKRSRQEIDDAADTADTLSESDQPLKKSRQSTPSDVVARASRTRPWKDIYSERLVVERNWRKGRYHVKTFTGHTDGIMCLQFDENTLITGSYDKTVRVWDLETGETLRVLRGHTRDVRALQFDDAKLITGSMDRTLKIWNYRTGECIRTLEGHNEGIVSLNFDANILASGSVDASIKVWDFRTQTCFTLTGHKDWVNRVAVFQTTHLFSASDDTTVRLWDLTSRSCIREFTGHVGQVQCLQAFVPHHAGPSAGSSPPPNSELMARSSSFNFNDSTEEQHLRHPLHIDTEESTALTEDQTANTAATSNTASENADSETSCALPSINSMPHLITGSLDNTLKIWDISTGRIIKTLFGHLEGVWSVASDSLRLVSGAHDRTVKVWDKDSGRCLHTLVGHQGPVTCVAVGDEGLICSGSDDCTVRVWDFRKT